jgi:LuxR family maltose regulon positive regulatory protein
METPGDYGLPLRDAIFLPQSLLSYEANELTVAYEQAQRALALLSPTGFAQGIIWGKYILARIHLARGEYEAMGQITREGFQLTSELGTASMQGVWFTALEAQGGLQQGLLTPTARWAEKAGFSPNDTPHYWLEYPYFTYVRLLLAQGRLAQAQQLLTHIEQSARSGGRVRKRITTFLLQALAWLAQNKMEKALTYVEQALALAAPQGYRRPFLDEGQLVMPLLSRARGSAPAFVDELLADFAAVGTRVDGDTALLDPLSKRELDVLRLVARGLSNREIAETLVVTLGTVKKHLNNIFSKLDVKSRTQAVARARELGLLA